MAGAQLEVIHTGQCKGKILETGHRNLHTSVYELGTCWQEAAVWKSGSGRVPSRPFPPKVCARFRADDTWLRDGNKNAKHLLLASRTLVMLMGVLGWMDG